MEARRRPQCHCALAVDGRIAVISHLVGDGVCIAGGVRQRLVVCRIRVAHNFFHGNDLSNQKSRCVGMERIVLSIACEASMEFP